MRVQAISEHDPHLKIRDFSAQSALKSQTDIVSPQISHTLNFFLFIILIKTGTTPVFIHANQAYRSTPGHPPRVKTEGNKIAAGCFPVAHICGYDEIGKHAGFRFQCRKACGFESHYPYHVAADDISFAATFFKSHLSLILPRLLSKSNPLRWASIWSWEQT